MSIVIKNLSYNHSDKSPLFNAINLTLNKGEKANLIGANGTGKSTLLKLIAAQNNSAIHIEGISYYLPQIKTIDTENTTIYEALAVNKKLIALQQILKGSINEQDYIDLNDDWQIEEKIQQALSFWQIESIDLTKKMNQLSGGQQMRIYFAAILIHQPDILLLDEPTNHIDVQTKHLLFQFIEQYKGSILLVSHDIELLNKQSISFELTTQNLKKYQGNYDAYKAQKKEELIAIQHKIDYLNKDIKQVKVQQQKLLQKQQKAVSQNKKAEQKAGLPKIVINTLKNAAENSSAKNTELQQNKKHKLQDELWQAKTHLEQLKPLNFSFNNSNLHSKKVLFTLKNVNYIYKNTDKTIWKETLNLEIRSGERILIEGKNGCGKSTLLNVLAGKLQPTIGSIERFTTNIIYLDQFYSLLNLTKTVLEQAQEFNHQLLSEMDLKNTLFQYGFSPEIWHKPIHQLSGGERLRLSIGYLNLAFTAIDVLLLDEPSNNLDIYGLEHLYSALKTYQGTIIFISHDTNLRHTIAPTKTIQW